MQNETINHACDELPFLLLSVTSKEKQNELARNIYI